MDGMDAGTGLQTSALSVFVETEIEKLVLSSPQSSASSSVVYDAGIPLADALRSRIDAGVSIKVSAYVPRSFPSLRTHKCGIITLFNSRLLSALLSAIDPF